MFIELFSKVPISLRSITIDQWHQSSWPLHSLPHLLAHAGFYDSHTRIRPSICKYCGACLIYCLPRFSNYYHLSGHEDLWIPPCWADLLLFNLIFQENLATANHPFPINQVILSCFLGSFGLGFGLVIHFLSQNWLSLHVCNQNESSVIVLHQKRSWSCYTCCVAEFVSIRTIDFLCLLAICEPLAWTIY